MADVSYEIQKQIQSKTVTDLKKVVLVESTVSTNDTVPITELSTITSAVVLNATSGATLTCSVATNVVTITQSTQTNVKCIILALGT